MTETFDKLKALLTEQKTLSNDDVSAMEAEHGEMTDEEKMELEAAKLEIEKQNRDAVSLDDYLAALQVLDEADEGSDAYQQAEATVQQYESGG